MKDECHFTVGKLWDFTIMQALGLLVGNSKASNSSMLCCQHLAQRTSTPPFSPVRCGPYVEYNTPSGLIRQTITTIPRHTTNILQPTSSGTTHTLSLCCSLFVFVKKQQVRSCVLYSRQHANSITLNQGEQACACMCLVCPCNCVCVP